MHNILQKQGVYFTTLKDIVLQSPSIYYDVTTIQQEFNNLPGNLIVFANNTYISKQTSTKINFKAGDIIYVLYASDKEPDFNYKQMLSDLIQQNIRVYVYCNAQHIKQLFESLNIKVLGLLTDFLQMYNIVTTKQSEYDSDNNANTSDTTSELTTESKRRGRKSKITNNIE